MNTACKTPRLNSLMWFPAAAIGVVALGIGYYVWLCQSYDDTPQKFGIRGDAMAPFAALLSAATLFAAIDGMRMQRRELQLQRRELVLQRRELSESRKVMQEQARAAERSAEVQQRLAEAQEALTRRQYESNLRAHYAQIASIDIEIVRVEARAAEVRYGEQPNRGIIANELDGVKARLVDVSQRYADKTSGVVGTIPLIGHADRDDA